MAVETPVKATNKSDTILYVYRPRGIDDRAVGIMSILVKVDKGYRKIQLKRGTNKLARRDWEALQKSPRTKELQDSEQLFLVAESDNLIKDFIGGQSSSNGSISIEKLINNCVDRDLVDAWRSYLVNSDLTVNSKHGALLKQINTRLETASAFDVPRSSNAPLNPAKAIVNNDYMEPI